MGHIQTTGPQPAPEQPPRSAENKPLLPLSFLIGGALVLAVLAALFLLSRRTGPPSPPPLTEETLAYAENIRVGEFHMSAEGNFLGQDVVYVDGKVSNVGDRAVRQLRVRVYFYDRTSQVILEEEQDIVRVTAAPLAPGETRDFRLYFDSVPPSWSVQLPQFQLVSLQLEGPH